MGGRLELINLPRANNVNCRVLESKDAGFPVGTIVEGPMGCRTHGVLPTTGNTLRKLDYLQDLPVSIGVGAAGMPGYVLI